MIPAREQVKSPQQGRKDGIIGPMSWWHEAARSLCFGVGAGPRDLMAVHLARYSRDVLVIDKGRSQARY
jgi:hypothetical protein